VDHDDVPAGAEQLDGGVAADVAGATGQQGDSGGHPSTVAHRGARCGIGPAPRLRSPRTAAGRPAGRHPARRPPTADRRPTGGRPMSDPYADFPHLRFDRPPPGVLRITIDGPGLNAVDHAAHRELADVWRAVDRDPETNVALLQGAGRAFSAGGSFDLLEDI